MAIVEIRVPDIGDFEDIPVIEVHVAPGAEVNAEDPLITLESEKATMEVPSPHAGRVVEDGPSHTVFSEPKHPYTKALAAAFPTIGDMRFRKAPLGLAGDPPDPRELPPGCPFVPRCSEAIDECSVAEPELLGAGPMRHAACIRVEDRA